MNPRQRGQGSIEAAEVECDSALPWWSIAPHLPLLCPTFYLRRSSHLNHCGCASAVLSLSKAGLSSFLIQHVGLPHVDSIAVHCTARVQSPSLRLRAIETLNPQGSWHMSATALSPFALGSLPRASCFRVTPIWTLTWQCLS